MELAAMMHTFVPQKQVIAILSTSSLPKYCSHLHGVGKVEVHLLKHASSLGSQYRSALKTAAFFQMQ